MGHWLPIPVMEPSCTAGARFTLWELRGPGLAAMPFLSLRLVEVVPFRMVESVVEDDQVEVYGRTWLSGDGDSYR